MILNKDSCIFCDLLVRPPNHDLELSTKPCQKPLILANVRSVFLSNGLANVRSLVIKPFKTIISGRGSAYTNNEG